MKKFLLAVVALAAFQAKAFPDYDFPYGPLVKAPQASQPQQSAVKPDQIGDTNGNCNTYNLSAIEQIHQFLTSAKGHELINRINTTQSGVSLDEKNFLNDAFAEASKLNVEQYVQRNSTVSMNQSCQAAYDKINYLKTILNL